MNTIVWETNLPGIQFLNRGKVRDLYAIGDRLLIVATDRLSAFDVVLPTPIPDKGRVLTQLSLFWFNLLRDVIPNHIVTATDFPAELTSFNAQLKGRTMLCRRTNPLPMECVVRGYLVGSGWKDYRTTGKVCGITLPPGLQESERLPEPIFTPSTKATTGHDENISFDQAGKIIGMDNAQRLKDLTLKIYTTAADYALTKGIIIADTKFEFGLVNGVITLADEVLTPDSSRFWPAATYKPGGSQPSYDKQYVRDYLESIHWNKQ